MNSKREELYLKLALEKWDNHSQNQMKLNNRDHNWTNFIFAFSLGCRSLDLLNETNKTIVEKQNENMQSVLDKGPGLRYSTNTWIIAKDPENKKVLIGGLGGLGVGQMWMDTEQRHLDDPEYQTAEIWSSK